MGLYFATNWAVDDKVSGNQEIRLGRQGKWGKSHQSDATLWKFGLKHQQRFPAKHLHQLVFDRLKELLEKRNFQSLIDRLTEHEFMGVPRFLKKRQEILGEIARLEDVVENFSQALRDSVAQKNESLVEVIETMVKEKETAIEEIAALKRKLSEIDSAERKFRENLKGAKFKKFAKLALDNIAVIHPLEQRKLIQSLIPRIVIHLGAGEAGEHRLHLFYDLDVNPSSLGTTVPNDGPTAKSSQESPNVISLLNHGQYLGPSGGEESLDTVGTLFGLKREWWS